MPHTVTSASTAAGSVLSQSANSVAAFCFFEPAVTAVVEPPQLPVRGSAASHCGIGAIAHLPWVLSALPLSTPGAHTALSQPTCVPSLSALFHSGVYIGDLSIAPSATRPCQYWATFLVAASS